MASIPDSLSVSSAADSASVSAEIVPSVPVPLSSVSESVAWRFSSAGRGPPVARRFPPVAGHLHEHLLHTRGQHPPKRPVALLECLRL